MYLHKTMALYVLCAYRTFPTAENPCTHTLVVVMIESYAFESRITLLIGLEASMLFLHTYLIEGTANTTIVCTVWRYNDEIQLSICILMLTITRFQHLPSPRIHTCIIRPMKIISYKTSGAPEATEETSESSIYPPVCNTLFYYNPLSRHTE